MSGWLIDWVKEPAEMKIAAISGIIYFDPCLLADEHMYGYNDQRCSYTTIPTVIMGQVQPGE